MILNPHWKKVTLVFLTHCRLYLNWQKKVEGHVLLTEEGISVKFE